MNCSKINQNGANFSPIGPLRKDLKPRGFLFEIKEVDKVVGYLFGSFHFAPKWILENFNSKTLEAYEFCNVLGVEVDITREDRVEATKVDITNSKVIGFFKDFIAAGVEDLNLEFTEENEEEFVRKGITLVQNTMLKKFGIDPERVGVDIAFIEKAKKRSMPIQDMESSFETHKVCEKQTKLYENGNGKTYYHELKKSYQNAIILSQFLESGDLKYIKKSNNKWSKEDKAFLLKNGIDVSSHENEMRDRNIDMVSSICKWIKSGQIPFAIAGASHFVGKYSIVKLLKIMGYDVNQIIVDEPR